MNGKGASWMFCGLVSAMVNSRVRGTVCQSEGSGRLEICPYRTLVNEVVGAPRAVMGFQSNPISSQKRGTIMTTAAYDEIASSSEFCITTRASTLQTPTR